MIWLQLGGALAIVFVVAGIAWALRLGRAGRIATPQAAAEAAEHSLAGFETWSAVVGADGSGALAVGSDGRVAAMKARGARIAVREVSWDRLRTVAGGILIETDERRFGQVLLSGVNALDVRRLATAGSLRKLRP